MLAATKDRHFLQVDSVSRACLRLRLRKPWSEDELRPLGGVLMAFLQFWVDHATEDSTSVSNILDFWGKRGY